MGSVGRPGRDSEGLHTNSERNSPMQIAENSKILVRRRAGNVWLSRGEVVTMMQPAEARHGNYLRARRCVHCRFPACRSLLRQPKMSAVLVIIANVIAHEPFQMALVQDNDMIEQVAAATPDKPLRHATSPILPLCAVSSFKSAAPAPPHTRCGSDSAHDY